ncbi:MAG TPA: endospore germination permease [Candidatus Nitrosocosmicus sp.]|nr:endospore germination permease [Candidatus Nitrosocosmicus sp.]
MIRNNDVISPYQIAMIIIMSVISVGVFSVASDAAEAAGADGWLIVALAGALNVLAVYIIVRLNSRFPGKTFAEYSQIIIGTVLGKALTFLFAVYLLMVIAYVTRAFTEVVKMFLLFRTPTEVIMLSLILACTYIVRGGAECIGRINELIFPILFIPFFVIMFFGFQQMEFSNMLPSFQTPVDKVITAVPALTFSFGGIELALFYIGFMRNPKKAYKPAIIAVLFITFFLVMVTVFCIAAFGKNATTQFLWPLVSYIRAISLPGLFIERLDGVILSLWMLTVFTTMVSAYFVLSYSISKVIGTKEHKQYVVPLSILIYYFALQPDSLAELYEWGSAVFPYAISAFLYVVPIVLLLLAKLRRLGVH